LSYERNFLYKNLEQQ